MNNDTAGALFALLIAGVVLVLAVLLVPAPARAEEECMTKEQARVRWPTAHIYWHGPDRCWDNRAGGGRRYAARAEEVARPRVKQDKKADPPPHRKTTNYLKLAPPSRDASGNIAHLSGAVLDVPTKNEIDEAADLPPDVIEDRPFAPWEERVGGQFR